MNEASSMSRRQRSGQQADLIAPRIGDPNWRPTEVHPLAALFPMLDEEDLAALAAHIKEHGLQTPITIDADGVLIDGRNRLAACEMAGVEPRYTFLNGHDPQAFIWGANCERRQLTQGQKAMIATVGGLSSTSQPRRDQGIRKTARCIGVNHQTFAKALAVKEYPDLAQEVIAGALSLDKCYDEADTRKRASESRESGRPSSGSCRRKRAIRRA